MLVDQRIWALFLRHWEHTMTYWSVFFSFGLSIAFLGPSISDLQCQTRSSLPEITWVFFVQQLFMLVGSASGGLFKKKLVFSLSALFSCTLVISLVFALIPLCPNVVLLAIAMALAGVAMGVIDTIANLQLVKLYQKDSAVFLQFLHLFIGLGALVVPLLVDPFLSDHGCVPGTNRTTNSSSPPGPSPHHPYVLLDGEAAALRNRSLDLPLAQGPAPGGVRYAFWIMALINLPIPLLVFTLMYRDRMLPCPRTSTRLLDGDRSTSPEPPESLEQQPSHSGVVGCCNLSKLRGQPLTFFMLHALGGAILFLIDGIIGVYTAFVFTYAISPPMEMEHRKAGCLNSVFWAAVTGGRLAFVYLSYRFNAARLLLLSLLGMVAVQTSLMVFYHSSVFLFVGTCLLGLCISSVFPCLLAFTEETLEYKGCATTVLVTSACTGEMVLQVLVGSVIQTQGSYTFLLCCTVGSMLAFGLLLLLLYVRHVHRNPRQGLSKDVAMRDIQSPGGQGH